MKANELASTIATVVGGLLKPITERLNELERERERRDASYADVIKAIDIYRERLDELDKREPTPGPPGPPGPTGAPGVDGKDGAPGLRYLGVYTSGKTYELGDVVTHGGSAWHCTTATTRAPGNSPDWVLMVKRGRDAREARI